jgi:twitching motility two-component system response regulator PilG
MPARQLTHRIMIIDDSAVVRAIIEGILIREGYLVDSFNDGPAAMKALSTHMVPPPDLLLLDIQLPFMDGYNVAKLFHQNRDLEHVIVVMVSGNDGMFDKFRGRIAGAKAYITKPFKPGVVLSVVHEQLAGGTPAAQEHLA